MTGMDTVTTIYGLEAIAAHNGWAIAIVGITIVFTGLVLLSLTIAQLHKILDIWDNREKLFQPSVQESRAAAGLPAEIALSGDMKEVVRQYMLLSKRLGDPLALPGLLDDAVKCGLVNPHSTINKLVTEGLLVSDDNGYFHWKR